MIFNHKHNYTNSQYKILNIFAIREKRNPKKKSKKIKDKGK